MIRETPIAERTLYAEEDPAMVVLARIYAPQRVAADTDSENFPWRCRYELSGAPGVRGFANRTSFDAPGLDSLDALINATSSLRAVLDRYADNGLTFAWSVISRRQGGHGIPHPMTTSLGPAHERDLIARMERDDSTFIARETEFMRRLRRFDDEELEGPSPP
jgi:hypothetical protein